MGGEEKGEQRGGGDGPWEAPHNSEDWGWAWGPARWSGGTVWPAAALAAGARSAPKQVWWGTARWDPGTVTGGRIGTQRKRNQIQFNSNDFKLLQILTAPKMPFPAPKI
jgi:hypothetical protein